MTTARFFDGLSTRPWPVALHAEGGVLYIEGDGWTRQVGAAELGFSHAYARAPGRIDLPDGANLEIDAAAFSAIRQELIGGANLIQRAEAAWSMALVALVVLLAAGISAYVWGIPFAADLIVTHLPRTVDARVGGDGTMVRLQALGIVAPAVPASAQEIHLARRFASVAAATGVPYRLVFRTLRGPPNAFTLPDGTILMSTQLETLAGDEDALMFVLGHELGHVYHRHAMRLLARATLSSIVMSWYLGDVSSAMAAAAVGVVQLSYSRAAEEEADAFGIQLMRANGIPTRPAANLFRKLEAGAEAATGQGAAAASSGAKRADSNLPDFTRIRIPAYLATHPASADRIRLLEADAPPSTR